MFLGLLEKPVDQLNQSLEKFEDLIPKVETHVQSNLIIAASPRMDLSSGFNAYPLNQKTFNVRMNIFLGGIQVKSSFSMEDFYRLQAFQEFSPILF